MPGHDKSQQIVAQLGRVHGSFGFRIFACKQEVQEIGDLAGASGFARGNRVICDLAHVLHGGPRKQPSGPRDPAGQAKHVKQRHFAGLRDIGINGFVNGGRVKIAFT